MHLCSSRQFGGRVLEFFMEGLKFGFIINFFGEIKNFRRLNKLTCEKTLKLYSFETKNIVSRKDQNVIAKAGSLPIHVFVYCLRS